MSAETSLYTKLSAAAGVTALVGNRIYPDVFPEGCTYPAAVFTRTKTEPVQSLSGISFGADVDLTIGVWGKTRTEADAAASAIESALAGSEFVRYGRDAAFDPETGLFATSLIFLFFEV